MAILAVVAYPIVSEADRRWIEGIRVRHDPLAPRIAAHVTLVFPAEMAEAPALAQVRHALRLTEPFPVLLGRAAVSPDVVAGGSYVGLRAAEGERELLALHEALHTGVLAAHRRRDLPFTPHVTVARYDERAECERIAGELNQEHREVRARIDGVDLVEVEASVVRAVARVPLGPGP